MRSYAAARGMFSFLAGVSWIIIVLGLLMALIAASASGGQSAFGGRPSGAMVLLSTVPGLFAAFVGFLGLVGVQIGRATVDSAEYGQQALDVARKQLEVSRQALRQGIQAQESYRDVIKRNGEATAPVADRASMGSSSSTSYSSPNSSRAGPEILPDQTVIYKGRTVRFHSGAYLFGGRHLETVGDLVAAIDRMNPVEEPAYRWGEAQPNGDDSIGGVESGSKIESTVNDNFDRAKSAIESGHNGIGAPPLGAPNRESEPDFVELENGDVRYLGKLIRRGEAGYFYGGQTFPTLDAAKVAVGNVVALQQRARRTQR